MSLYFYYSCGNEIVGQEGRGQYKETVRGLKPTLLERLAARLKPCPDTGLFLQASKVVPF